MADLERMIADMEAEGQELDGLVARLPDEEWSRPTPAAGWTIGHQIGHLAWTDEMSLIAVTRPGDFGDVIERVLTGSESGSVPYVDDVAAELAALGPAALLSRWRDGRTRLAEALAGVPKGTRLPWFGVEMSAPSMATARIMETWAHGQDIVDALDVTRAPGPRLWYVAHIGVRARDFAFMTNGLDVPAEEFRVELTAPDGKAWSWGPEDAAQRVSGAALDFCVLVTQRRHLDDLELKAEGPDARTWLTIAQAFAGPPGGGREPGQFA
jgi:uncharacterized protein (TIGR03084 family)